MRRYFEEGTEVGHQIIEDSGWYVYICGMWCWDEHNQGAAPQDINEGENV